MFKGRKLKDVLKSSHKPDSKAASPGNSTPSGGSRFKSISSAIKSGSISDVAPVSGSSMARIFESREVCKQGVQGKITAVAYEQTQSLLAVASDAGDIHVFGQKQVEVVFTFDSRDHIKSLMFVKGIYLVAINSKDVIVVLSLYSKAILATVFAPGKVTCVETDPSLDWILIGLQSGTVIVYDVDRDQLSEFKIENLQKLNFFTKGRVSPVVSITWNPRDIGSVLISYEMSTVIYSLADRVIKQHFIYELSPGAPGGEYSYNVNEARFPTVIQSLFHPNSLHVLTVHEDNSLVFWDANTGQLIQARTVYDTDIHIPQNGLQKHPPTDIPRILKASWICQNNPEYTSLLIAYKPASADSYNQSLTLLDFGSTPLYTITTYDSMSKYYAKPKEQKIFPLSNNAHIKDFLPLSRGSPFFGGCHDPAIVLLVFENGEIETMLYPSGSFTTKSTLLPQTLSWLRPRVTESVGLSVPKQLWLGVLNSQRKEMGILKGGFPIKRETRNQDVRSAVATGHTNGSVRIWDASQSELDDTSVYEVNLASVLNVGNKLPVTNISFSANTLELAVSIESGDVVLFKFEANRYFNPDGKDIDRNLEMKFRRFSLNESQEILVDVSERASPALKKGFIPNTAIHAKRGKVATLKNSNVGFVGISYSEGTLMLIDRRGPAIIYMENIKNNGRTKGSVITAIEFVVIEYGDDGYSSIIMLCGTNVGELLTFKILPNGGRFEVELVEVVQTNDASPVIYIGAFEKSSGHSCEATIEKMQMLSTGTPLVGYIVVTTSSDSRVLRIGKSKESHKSSKYQIISSSLSYIPYLGSKGDEKLGTVLVNFLATGEIKVMSTPDLKELKSLHSPVTLQSRFIEESSVLQNGDILVRNGQFNSVLISIINEQATGMNPQSMNVDKSDIGTDTLYNPTLKIPYRPQVNSLQWVRGTIYIDQPQLDALLSGNRRAPSKYAESEIAEGTVILKPPKKASQKSIEAGGTYRPEDMGYKVPVRHGQKSGGYNIIKSAARVVESQYDYVEGSFNDYATAVGESMNEAVDSATKDLMKGAIGF